MLKAEIKMTLIHKINSSTSSRSFNMKYSNQNKWMLWMNLHCCFFSHLAFGTWHPFTTFRKFTGTACLQLITCECEMWTIMQCDLIVTKHFLSNFLVSIHLDFYVVASIGRDFMFWKWNQFFHFSFVA